MKQFFHLFFLAGFLSLGCKESGPFQEAKIFAGGKKVSKQTLNLGYTTYVEYCVQCHGPKGDGNGFAAKGLVPAPRNLTLGVYKFGEVVAGGLLYDEDFAKIIRKGLHGTAMLAWDISDERLDAVTQYLKTFAPQVWEKAGAELGEKITLNKDPYGLARQSSAIEKGKEVYHMTANCYSCHRAYATVEELNVMAKNKNTSAPTIDKDFYNSKLQDSEYGAKTLPPDFTWHEVRSASTVEELYVRLAAGVGGTAMPSWKGTLEDDEIWAVAYYVKSLMDLKRTPERDVLMGKLKTP